MESSALLKNKLIRQDTKANTNEAVMEVHLKAVKGFDLKKTMDRQPIHSTWKPCFFPGLGGCRFLTNRMHVWYIYRHFVDLYGKRRS